VAARAYNGRKGRGSPSIRSHHLLHDRHTEGCEIASGRKAYSKLNTDRATGTACGRHFRRNLCSLLLAALFAISVPLWAQNSFQQQLAHAEDLIAQGQLQSAEQEFLALVRLDPKSPVVRNDLGALYMNQNRYDRACREFSQAAALDPKSAPIQQNLGICYLKTNDFAKAMGALENAEHLAPDDVRTHYFLGHSCFMLDRYDEAEKELEYVATRKPEDESTLFYLIRIYAKKEEEQKAKDTFRELSQAHPDSVFVHILMGESYDLQDKPQQAIDEFRKALPLAPDMPRLHFDLGVLLWEDHQTDEAEKVLLQESQINPHFPPVYYYLAEIMVSREQYPKAIKLFQMALKEGPQCINARVGLGKAYAREEKWDQALGQLQQANMIDANQKDVHYWLGTIYRHLGNKTKSAEEFQVYQSLAKDLRPGAVGASDVPHSRWVSNTCLPYVR
jgi:tetratricopeptide (TPR) repeat protein